MMRGETSPQFSHRQSERVQEAQGRLAAIVESSWDAIVSKTSMAPSSIGMKLQSTFLVTPQKKRIGQHITLIVPPDRLDEEADILASLRLEFRQLSKSDRFRQSPKFCF